jgi:transposase
VLIVPQTPTAHTPRAPGACVPWHDQHPERLALEQRLPAEHLARRLDLAVARLDLHDLLASYGSSGSAPYPPGLLLRAVLFQTERGHHSPATWYREARECEPLRWLLRGLLPSRSCWYTFRDRLAPLLPSLNDQPVAQALAAGLTPATRAAADGTLIAANASRHRLLNEATLEQRLRQLRAALAADSPSPPTSVAPAAPAATDPVPPTRTTRPYWMAKQPAGRRAQHARYLRAQGQLAQRQVRNRGKVPAKRTAPARLVISTSDPEAALGLDKEKTFRPLYNVQVVDDLDSPFLLGYEVFAQPNDAGLLGTLLRGLQAVVRQHLAVLLTDTGYAGGADLRAAAELGVTVYAPLPKDNPTAKQLPKSAFPWLPEAQTYQCPQGHRLVLEATGRTRRSSPEHVVVQRFRCPPVHCLACPLQAQCAKQPRSGRTVSRSEYEPEVEALRQRMTSPAAQELYKLRKQTVELVNADWKEHRRSRRFSGRGLTRVRGQVGLMVLVHNLLTLLAEEKKKTAADAALSPTDIAT